MTFRLYAIQMFFTIIKLILQHCVLFFTIIKLTLQHCYRYNLRGLNDSTSEMSSFGE